jgi:hypothetical protein
MSVWFGWDVMGGVMSGLLGCGGALCVHYGASRLQG